MLSDLTPPRGLTLLSTLALLLLSWLGGCAGGVDEAPSAVEGASSAIVYGIDNRTDVYAHASADWRALVRESIAVMVPTYALDRAGGLSASSAETLQDAFDLCSGERFATQPAVGMCSGTLIAEDLILTAGHCIDDRSCSQNAWVFDYYYEANGRLANSGREDVYRCAAVEAHVLEDAGVDFAIVRLDRPVSADRKPAPVRRATGALAVGSGVTLVGFPSGIPAKIAGGGRVSNARARTLDYFEANVDAFGGNSGSGVFNDNGELVGVLVRGAQDYRYSNGCYIVNTVREETDDGEDITYVQNALSAACQQNRVLSDVFCHGADESEPDWCGACQNDYDCGDGFICGEGSCTRTCNTNRDCRDDHACVNQVCSPNISYECNEGDVWGLNACGRSIGRVQECLTSQTCVNGGCLSYDTGNTCDDARRLEPNSARVEGALVNATHTLRGACGGNGPEHVYALSLPRAATVTATATAGFDTVLYLREGCIGAERACNDDGTPPGGRGSRISVALPAGDYALILDSYEAQASGAYQLDIEVVYEAAPPSCEDACELGARRCAGEGVEACVEVEGCAAWRAVSVCEAGCEGGACVAGVTEAGGDTCADAYMIEARDQTLSGDLRDFNADQQGTCGGRGPEVYARFTLYETTLVDVTVSGVDSVVYLLSGCEAELACNDDATPPGAYGSHLLEELATGVYTIVIDSYAQGGVFEAQVQFAASAPACVDACQPGAARCVGDGASLCIEGREGCWVWSAPEPCVSGCAEGVCLAAVSGEGEACQDATRVDAVDQTLRGSLAAYNADLRGSCGGNGADRVYTFTLNAPATLTATATGFDAVLYLTSACGQAEAELACNDDATPPGNYGAQISLPLAAGTYFLVLDAYRTAGDYALTLEFN